jgi:hypothetical protein
MGVIDDLFKSNLAVGLAVGVGAILLAPVVAPILASVGKPLAKSAIKSGIILFEKGREAAAELTEVMEDLIAEARAELAASAPGTAATGGAAAEIVPAAEAAAGVGEEG